MLLLRTLPQTLIVVSFHEDQFCFVNNLSLTNPLAFDTKPPTFGDEWRKAVTV